MIEKLLTGTLSLNTNKQNLFIPYVNMKDADQPVHPSHNPCSLISIFIFHCLDRIIHCVAISKLTRLSLASSVEQARLSLTWTWLHNFKTRFSHDNVSFNLCFRKASKRNWLCELWVKYAYLLGRDPIAGMSGWNMPILWYKTPKQVVWVKYAYLLGQDPIAGRSEWNMLISLDKIQ